MTRLSVRRRALAVMAVFAVAGSTACGSDSDDGGGDDEQALRTKVGELQDALYGSDGKTYCAGLSAEARSRTERAIRRTGNGGAETCESLVDELVPKPQTTAVVAATKSAIVSIAVDDDRAVVVTKEPTERPPHDTPFVKQDGEWLLDEPLVPTR